MFKNPIQDIKTSHFISLCIFRALPQQKIPRELCGGEIPSIFPLHSHVPVKRAFDGMEQENSRRKEETDQENSKKQEAKNGGKKKKRFLIIFLTYVEVSIQEGSPSGYRPHVKLPQENPLLVWEPPLQHNLSLIDLGGKFCLINHSPLTLKKSKKVFTPFGKTSEIFLSVSGGTLTKPKIL